MDGNLMMKKKYLNQKYINAFWKEFKKVCPSVIIKKANKNKKGRMIIPCLIKAHEDWGKYKGL